MISIKQINSQIFIHNKVFNCKHYIWTHPKSKQDPVVLAEYIRKVISIQFVILYLINLKYKKLNSKLIVT